MRTTAGFLTSERLFAHLSLAVSLHEFDEWRVSFDLELHNRSILSCYLQVYVFVVFRLDALLSEKAQDKRRESLGIRVKGHCLLGKVIHWDFLRQTE